jgi:hypothetical protein
LRASSLFRQNNEVAGFHTNLTDGPKTWEIEMNEPVDTKVQASQLENAYVALIANAKPRTLFAIARGHGIGAYCWSRPVEVLLTEGSTDATDFERDGVDLYLQTVMNWLPLDHDGIYLDLKSTKLWLDDLGVSDVDLNVISPRLSKARRDRAIERCLVASPIVIAFIRSELMREVPEALTDIRDALEFYQGLPSRFENCDPLDVERPCLF